MWKLINKLLNAIYKQSQIIIIDCLIAILEQNLSIPLLCTGRLFLHEMTVLTFYNRRFGKGNFLWALAACEVILWTPKISPVSVVLFIRFFGCYWEYFCKWVGWCDFRSCFRCIHINLICMVVFLHSYVRKHERISLCNWTHKLFPQHNSYCSWRVHKVCLIHSQFFFYWKTLIGDRWTTFAFTVTSFPTETLLSLAKVTLLVISTFGKSMFGQYCTETLEIGNRLIQWRWLIVKDLL